MVMSLWFVHSILTLNITCCVSCSSVIGSLCYVHLSSFSIVLVLFLSLVSKSPRMKSVGWRTALWFRWKYEDDDIYCNDNEYVISSIPQVVWWHVMSSWQPPLYWEARGVEWSMSCTVHQLLVRQAGRCRLSTVGWDFSADRCMLRRFCELGTRCQPYCRQRCRLMMVVPGACGWCVFSPYACCAVLARLTQFVFIGAWLMLTVVVGIAGDHLREEYPAVHGARPATAGAELPGHSHPPAYDPGGQVSGGVCWSAGYNSTGVQLG